LTLINPEWAPIVNGQRVDSDPVLISGTVERMHGETGGDFPSTHALSDVVLDVIVDPEHENKVATGNDEEHEIAFEWEVGKYPDWAWPGFEDRIYGLGRHIFDCGHTGIAAGHCSATTATACVLDGDCRPPVCSSCLPDASETCEGEHFGYSSELHPPHATAVIRQGRGAALSRRKKAKPAPATIADVWVSPDGGGAGDRCVLTHRMADLDQLTVECWPLAEPVAQINAVDFTFSVPLPPRPAGAGKPRWRLVAPPASSEATTAPGDRPARLKVKKQLSGPTPSLEVTVRMTKKVRGELPTGFAGRIVAGWNDRTTTLTHVRVTVSDLLVENALMRSTPLVPRTCSVADTPCATDADCPSGETCLGEGAVKGWRGQVAANGEWRRYSGTSLDDVVSGSMVPLSIGFDQYLPANGVLRLQADAFARECINTAYGHSLADGLKRYGLLKGLQCLGLDESHAAGKIDEIYPGPAFGAGPAGTQTYETESTGGEGGQCSITTGTLCVVDTDCATGETCNTTGGAFRLRYTIEKLS
ncbi:MAG: hypothetical protein ACREQL_08330, partial [Candidatus Binatia bacterium]